MLESILAVLPASIRRIVTALPREAAAQLEELRIREQRPLEMVAGREYAFLSAGGGMSGDPVAAYRPTSEDCRQILDLLTQHSMYSFSEELQRGYVTIRGGHRVGLSGRVVAEEGTVKRFRDISGFNIRLARERIGAGKTLLPCLMDSANSRIHHTLIISPPQRGKTTLLRDLTRLISKGEWPVPFTRGGFKVGVVDERSEIAGCHKGVPTFDVGPRTDVLDRCPKAEGMMMMIRSMSPEVLVVDEIGSRKDAESIREALNAGIQVIATAHGDHLEHVRKRPALRQLFAESLFSRYVILSGRQGTDFRFAVYDGGGRPLDGAWPRRKAGM